MSGVVFDCDGVLVDSEPLSARAWDSLTERYGYRVTDDDIAACVGRTEVATWEYLSSRVGLPPYAEAIDAVDQVRWRLYDEELRAFPDAVATVRALAMEGIPLAVASSSRAAEVARKLERVDLARYFAAVVGGDEVPLGKPAPDVYLAAADRLGVAAASCLAVEDSAAGAEAAQAAGMRVVVVARGGPAVAGHTVLSSLEAELLKSWIQ